MADAYRQRLGVNLSSHTEQTVASPRVSALHRFGVLGTLAEARFDDICELLQKSMQGNHVCLCLFEDEQLWTKSTAGHSQLTQATLHWCAKQVLQQGDVVYMADLAPVVPPAIDTKVADESHAFAGYPLRSVDNCIVGVLCFFQTNSPSLTASQRHQFELFGQICQRELLKTDPKSEALSADMARLQVSFAQVPATTTLQEPLQQLLSILACEFGFIGEVVHTDEPQLIRNCTVAKQPNLNSVEHFLANEFCIDDLTSHCGQIITQRQVVLINEPQPHRDCGLPEYFPAIRSILAVPLLVQDELVAVLGLFNKAQGFQPADVTAIQSLLPIIAQQVKSRSLMRQFAAQRDELLLLSTVAVKTTNAVIITDPAGFIMWANPHFEHISGYRLSEVIGLKPGALLQGPATDAATIQTMREALTAAKPFAVEIINYHKNRTPYWISIYTDPIFDDSGALKGFIAIERDITTEKQQRELSLQNEQRLTAVIEATLVGTWEWNIQTGETRFNERWANMIGYSLAELEPVSINTWLQHAHPDDLAISEAALQSHFKGETSHFDVHCRMRHKNGHWVWVHDRGQVISWTHKQQPLMMYGTHVDISQQKQIEQQLKQSRDDFESLLNNMPAVSYRRSTTEQFVFISPQFSALTGIGIDEITSGKIQFTCRIHPEDVPLFNASVANPVLQRDWNINYRLQHRSGHWIWVNDRGSHRLDANHELLYSEGFLVDISTEVQAQQTIMHQLNSLEALWSIASSTSEHLEDHIVYALQKATAQMGFCEALVLQLNQQEWPVLYASNSARQQQSFPPNSSMLRLLDTRHLIELSSNQNDQHGAWLMAQQWRQVAATTLNHYKSHTGCLLLFVKNNRTIQPINQTERMFIQLFSQWLSSQLEQAHRSAQLQQLTAQIPGVVYQFQSWPDGRSAIPYASPGIMDIYRMTPAEVIEDASEVFNRLHPDDLEMITKSIEQSRDELSVWHCQYRTLFADGSSRWLEGNALPERQSDGSTLWHGYIHDITDEKQISLELTANEARLRSLFELSPVGIALNDMATGQFVEVNDALVAPTGYNRTEFLQLDYWQLTPEKYTQLEQVQLESLKQTGRYGPYEKEYIRRDGSHYPVLLNGILITEPSGRQLIWSIVEDISVRKDTERNLRKAKALAESTAYMKSMFLANMSHEIRTPLNGVIGMLDILSRTELSAQQLEYLQVALRSGHSLLAIINDILDFSKIEAGKVHLEVQPFSLQEAVDDVVSLFMPAANAKTIDLVADCQALDCPMVVGDITRFKQILSNLISNAVKFTAQGKVQVTVSTEQQQDRITCRVQVQDNGIGISAEQQERLFNSFTQADISTTRRFGGTGLGLAICKQLCLLMSGDISVSSQPGCGACFSFYVTFAAAKTAEAAQVEVLEALDIRTLAGRQILVVEDNPVNVMIAKVMLADAGMQVRVANDGAEAIALLQAEQTNPSAIEAVLMDCLMPVMDGFAATKAIRAGDAGVCWQTVPIIALTANAIEDERQKCLAVGMDDFLSKPIQAHNLYEKLLQYLPAISTPVTTKSTSISAIDSTPHNVVDSKPMSTTSDEQPPIDWSIAKLSQQLGSMASILPGLLDIFLQQSAAIEQQLPELYHAQDWEQLRLKAHTLKGSAGQLLLTQLSKAAAELENCCKAPVTVADIEFPLQQCHALLVASRAQITQGLQSLTH